MLISGVTKVFHDQMDKNIPIEFCNEIHCFNQPLNYELQMFEMVDVINLSKECYQDIKFSCYSAKITDHAAWMNRDGQIINYTCDCAKNNNTCFAIQGNSKCNCDAGDIVHRSDTMRITEKV